MEQSQLEHLRRQYHERLHSEVLGYRSSGEEVLNCADKDQASSVSLARGMLKHLGFEVAVRELNANTVGKLFTDATRDYVKGCFSLLSHVRPGTWLYSTGQKRLAIAEFEQYAHLASFNSLVKSLKDQPELQAALGGDYVITPDITVARRPLSDDEINAHDFLVGRGNSLVARHTPLLERNHDPVKFILHASISCKWTMRSDRAQNSRTEALNLVRSRKGNLPHIAVVTMEPSPTRLASLALGTGDLDCTYHAALYELQAAARDLDSVAIEVLDMLVQGRRLRDISDLPLDLAT